MFQRSCGSLQAACILRHMPGLPHRCVHGHRWAQAVALTRILAEKTDTREQRHRHTGVRQLHIHRYRHRGTHTEAGD